MIQSIIDGTFIPSLKLANGGILSDFGGSSAGGSASGKGGLRLINVLDPSLVKDFLMSSDGEQVILNTIAKNGAAVNQFLVNQ